MKKQSTDFTQLIALQEPSQARSREALERLLRAGEALLATNAYEEAGVSEIADKAQSSVGTFYRLLENKETLSLLLLQRFFVDAVAQVDEVCNQAMDEQLSVSEFSNNCVRALVRIYAGRGGVLRALILRASRDAVFRDKVHQLNNYIAARIAKVLRKHQQNIHHPKPRKAMATAVHMVLGALNQHTVTGNLGDLSASELIDELTRLMTSYLDVDA